MGAFADLLTPGKTKHGQGTFTDLLEGEEQGGAFTDLLPTPAAETEPVRPVGEGSVAGPDAISRGLAAGPFGGAYAVPTEGPGISERLGVPEIAQAFKHEFSDEVAADLGNRLRWYAKHLATLGGTLEKTEFATPPMGEADVWTSEWKRPAKPMRQELKEEAEELKGLGPALMPMAGQTATMAIEWGLIYPKLFAAFGMTGQAIQKIPQVARASKALGGATGIAKLAGDHPREMRALGQAVKSFAKGYGTGATMTAIKNYNEGGSATDLLAQMNKGGATVGAFAAAFSIASSIDTSRYASALRKEMVAITNQRYDAKGTQIRARYGKMVKDIRRSGRDPHRILRQKAMAEENLLRRKNLEMAQVDKAVAAVEQELMDLKSGMWRAGQEGVETPSQAAARLMKQGWSPGDPIVQGPRALQKGLGGRKAELAGEKWAETWRQRGLKMLESGDPKTKARGQHILDWLQRAKPPGSVVRIEPPTKAGPVRPGTTLPKEAVAPEPPPVGVKPPPAVEDYHVAFEGAQRPWWEGGVPGPVEKPLAGLTAAETKAKAPGRLARAGGRTGLVNEHIRLFRQHEQMEPGPEQREVAEQIYDLIRVINQADRVTDPAEGRGFVPPEMEAYREIKAGEAATEQQRQRGWREGQREAWQERQRAARREPDPPPPPPTMGEIAAKATEGLPPAEEAPPVTAPPIVRPEIPEAEKPTPAAEGKAETTNRAIEQWAEAERTGAQGAGWDLSVIERTRQRYGATAQWLREHPWLTLQGIPKNYRDTIRRMAGAGMLQMTWDRQGNTQYATLETPPAEQAVKRAARPPELTRERFREGPGDHAGIVREVSATGQVVWRVDLEAHRSGPKFEEYERRYQAGELQPWGEQPPAAKPTPATHTKKAFLGWWEQYGRWDWHEDPRIAVLEYLDDEDQEFADMEDRIRELEEAGRQQEANRLLDELDRVKINPLLALIAPEGKPTPEAVKETPPAPAKPTWDYRIWGKGTGARMIDQDGQTVRRIRKNLEGKTVLCENAKHARGIYRQGGIAIKPDGSRWAGEPRIATAEESAENAAYAAAKGRITKAILGHPAYQAMAEAMRDQAWTDTGGLRRIYVPKEYSSEVEGYAGQNRGKGLWRYITHDKDKGQHWDDWAAEIGMEDQSLDAVLTRLQQMLEAQEGRGVHERALEEALRSGDPELEALAEVRAMLDSGHGIEETNRQVEANLREASEEYYHLTEQEIRAILDSVQIKETRRGQTQAQAERRGVRPPVGREDEATPAAPAPAQAAPQAEAAPEVTPPKTEKPPAHAGKADTDIFGQPEFRPATGKKQGELGLEVAPKGREAVPIKPELAKAVAAKAGKAKDAKALYLDQFTGKPDLFHHPDNPMPEMQEAWDQATKGRRLEGAGGAGGAAMAATGAGGAYGPTAFSESARPTTARRHLHRALRQSVQDDHPSILQEFLSLASPAHLSERARRGARFLRMSLAELAQRDAAAVEAYRGLHRAFAWMGREDIIAFVDRIEAGVPDPDPTLERIARVMRGQLDTRRDKIRSYGKHWLRHFHENYFPHIWREPGRVERWLAGWYGRRPIAGRKSFLKHRTIPTFKEGIAYGLEPVSWNPVDLVLLKCHEMDKFITFQDLLARGRRAGIFRFKYARSPAPEGYKKLDDYAFRVFLPPEMPMNEAYDEIMVTELMNVARNLGIDTKRFMKLKGGAWGYARWPRESPRTGPYKVRTKFAGPEFGLTHEIGHILGVKYGLFELLRRQGEGEYREVTRGKNKGQMRFHPNPEAVEYRKTIEAEWRALADLRYEGQEYTSPYMKSYVRKAREKEAVLLQALIHAPQRFAQVAPNLHDGFTHFLEAHEELRPLLDVKGSLVLGVGKGKLKIPGVTQLGEWVAPAEIADLINNHLSPGLRNNRNRLIADAYNLTRATGNLLNMVQLGLSAFHGLNVTTDMWASTLGLGVRQLFTPGQRARGLGRIASSPIAPAQAIWRGTRIRHAYRQQIDQIADPKLQRMVELVVAGGGRDRMDPVYYNQAWKHLRQDLDALRRDPALRKMQAALHLPFDVVGAAAEMICYPLMQWYVPTGKIGLFSLLAQHEFQRAQDKHISTEQLWERLVSVWDSVDNRMGELVYDNLFWNRTLKDLLLLSFRSVGWNLGSWREYGGIPVDIAGTKARIQRGDIWFSQKMAYGLGAVLVYGIMGAVTQYILTGRRPEEPKDYFFPQTGRTDPSGKPERLSFPTYAKDWFAYSDSPVDTVVHKFHPMWAILQQLARNSDFFRTEIRDEDDPVTQQLVDVARYIGRQFLPISVQKGLKMQRTAPETPVKNALVALTGIQPAPSYITRTPAEKLMNRIAAEHRGAGAISQEQRARYDYRRIFINRLRKGDPVDRREAARVLGRTGYRSALQNARRDPFAVRFARLSLPDALNVYALCNDQERAQVERLVRQKYGNARPETRTLEIRALYRGLMNEGD